MTTARDAVDQMLAAVEILTSAVAALEADAPVGALQPSLRLVERRIRRVNTIIAQRPGAPLADELPATYFSPEDAADRLVIDAARRAGSPAAVPAQHGESVRAALIASV